MSTPKDNFESRLARVFGGLDEKTTSPNPLTANSKPQGKDSDKPVLPPSRWDRTTPPGLASDSDDEGVEANDDEDVVNEKEKDLHATAPPQLVPDYVQNPQKWKRYDLSEESLEESEYKGLHGDHLNKRVAFQFLGDLRKRKGLEQGVRLDDDEEEERGQSGGKVVFQRPRPPQQGSAPAAGPRGGTGVVTMPQYEFGARPPSQKRAKVIPIPASVYESPELQRSDEEEEEEDEEEDRGAEDAYSRVPIKQTIQLPHLGNDADDDDEDEDDDDTGGLKIYDIGGEDSNSNSPRDNPYPQEAEENSEGEDA